MEVAVIDLDSKRLDRIQTEVNANLILGSGSHPAVLLEAEINYLKKYICNDSLNLKDQKIKVFGRTSLLWDLKSNLQKDLI